ncbi:MAG: dethiobiotin synthase [Spirochaetales bacterium]|nr:dethiobiotin synthase [Spirochaetales bacterium]
MTYFITGIDTGIGKTWTTGLLLRFLLSQKLRAVSAKLVQTGGRGLSDDLLEHRKIAGLPILDVDLQGRTCPYIFERPMSPHWAASMEGKIIDEKNLTRQFKNLEESYEVVLCEGAGGILVPLSLGRTSADFVAEQGWKTIVVTVPRLGSLNHTLLTLSLLETKGIPLAGIVLNQADAWGAELHDVFVNYFQSQMPAVPLIEIPQLQPSAESREVKNSWGISSLFSAVLEKSD